MTSPGVNRKSILSEFSEPPNRVENKFGTPILGIDSPGNTVNTKKFHEEIISPNPNKFSSRRRRSSRIRLSRSKNKSYSTFNDFSSSSGKENRLLNHRSNELIESEVKRRKKSLPDFTPVSVSTDKESRNSIDDYKSMIKSSSSKLDATADYIDFDYDSDTDVDDTISKRRQTASPTVLHMINDYNENIAEYVESEETNKRMLKPFDMDTTADAADFLNELQNYSSEDIEDTEKVPELVNTSPSNLKDATPRKSCLSTRKGGLKVGQSAKAKVTFGSPRAAEFDKTEPVKHGMTPLRKKDIRKKLVDRSFEELEKVDVTKFDEDFKNDSMFSDMDEEDEGSLDFDADKLKDMNKSEEDDEAFQEEVEGLTKSQIFSKQSLKRKFDSLSSSDDHQDIKENYFKSLKENEVNDDSFDNETTLRDLEEVKLNESSQLSDSASSSQDSSFQESFLDPSPEEENDDANQNILKEDSSKVQIETHDPLDSADSRSKSTISQKGETKNSLSSGQVSSDGLLDTTCKRMNADFFMTYSDVSNVSLSETDSAVLRGANEGSTMVKETFFNLNDVDDDDSITEKSSTKSLTARSKSVDDGVRKTFTDVTEIKSQNDTSMLNFEDSFEVPKLNDSVKGLETIDEEEITIDTYDNEEGEPERDNTLLLRRLNVTLLNSSPKLLSEPEENEEQADVGVQAKARTAEKTLQTYAKTTVEQQEKETNTKQVTDENSVVLPTSSMEVDIPQQFFQQPATKNSKYPVVTRKKSLFEELRIEKFSSLSLCGSNKSFSLQNGEHVFYIEESFGDRLNVKYSNLFMSSKYKECFEFEAELKAKLQEEEKEKLEQFNELFELQDTDRLVGFSLFHSIPCHNYFWSKLISTLILEKINEQSYFTRKDLLFFDAIICRISKLKDLVYKCMKEGKQVFVLMKQRRDKVLSFKILIQMINVRKRTVFDLVIGVKLRSEEANFVDSDFKVSLIKSYQSQRFNHLCKQSELCCLKITNIYTHKKMKRGTDWLFACIADSQSELISL